MEQLRVKSISLRMSAKRRLYKRMVAFTALYGAEFQIWKRKRLSEEHRGYQRSMCGVTLMN